MRWALFSASILAVSMEQYYEERANNQQWNNPLTPWKTDHPVDHIEQSIWSKDDEDSALDRVRDAILSLSPPAQKIFLRLIFIQQNERLSDDERITRLTDLEQSMTPEIRGEIAERLNQAAGSTDAIMRYMISRD